MQAAIGDGAICTINALPKPSIPAPAATAMAGRAASPAASTFRRRICSIPQTNTFLPRRRTAQEFDAVGAMDRAVINYCGGGIAASADALALTMLGHANVKLYDASMSEWAKDDALPMETG